jgi:hypothetical protein
MKELKVYTMSSTLRFCWLHYDSRSGSTFLAHKLTSQYKLFSPPEVNFIPKVLTRFDESGLSQESKDSICNIICKDPKHVDWLLSEKVVNELLSTLGVNDTASDLLHTLLRPLLNETNDSPNVIMFKKKYLSVVSLIDKLIPSSRHFILIRDGRAVMHSKLSSIKSTTQRPFTTSVLKAFIKWKSVIDHSRRLQNKDNVFVIKYEEMITNSVYLSNFGQTHNLEMRTSQNDDKYLLPERYNYGLHENITKPADSSILNKWKQKCPPARIKLYEYLAKDYLIEHGYELQYKQSVFHLPYILPDIARMFSEMSKDAWRKI